MSIVIILIIFVLALVVSVYFHELGHFVAAKRAGIGIEEFGLGFPPRLLAIRRGDTVYSINAIPLGAFVKTTGENDPSLPRSLASKGAWTRFGIYAAGPVLNIFLAFVFLSTFFLLPVAVIAGNGLMVHSVIKDSPADRANIAPGDIILEVNGHPVQKWKDMQDIIDSGQGDREITVLLEQGDSLKEIKLKPELDAALKRRLIGVLLCWNRVTAVEEGSPAYQAGLRPGDTILAINEQPIYNSESMSDALRSSETGKAALILLRDGKAISISLSPNEEEALSGIELQWVPGARLQQVRLPVWKATYLAGSYIIHMPSLIIEAIPLIKESPGMALVGPIGAGQLTIEAVRSSGLDNMLFIASLISLGIAIFNLFPLPPLDGGGMLVALIEGIRHGRRLSPQAVRLAHTVGTTLLILLMILVTFNDIVRLISGRGFGL